MTNAVRARKVVRQTKPSSTPSLSLFCTERTKQKERRVTQDIWQSCSLCCLIISNQRRAVATLTLAPWARVQTIFTQRDPTPLVTQSIVTSTIPNQVPQMSISWSNSTNTADSHCSLTVSTIPSWRGGVLRKDPCCKLTTTTNKERLRGAAILESQREEGWAKKKTEISRSPPPSLLQQTPLLPPSPLLQIHQLLPLLLQHSMHRSQWACSRRSLSPLPLCPSTFYLSPFAPHQSPLPCPLSPPLLHRLLHPPTTPHHRGPTSPPPGPRQHPLSTPQWPPPPPPRCRPPPARWEQLSAPTAEPLKLPSGAETATAGHFAMPASFIWRWE